MEAVHATQAILPSHFSLEFLRVIAELSKIVVLAMLIERVLVIVFEYRWYQKKLSGRGLKVPIAYTLSLVVCIAHRLDILSELFEPGEPTAMGIALTAAVVAGGSAGAITLFQGVLGFTKGTQDKLKEAKIAQAEARLAEAKACRAEAEERQREAEAAP